jgi:acyl carrier protein
MDDNITQQVKEIVAEYAGIEAAQVKTQDGLQSNLGLDSIDNVELLEAINETFSLQLSQADVAKVKTVAELIAIVKKSLEQK